MRRRHSTPHDEDGRDSLEDQTPFADALSEQPSTTMRPSTSSGTPAPVLSQPSQPKRTRSDEQRHHVRFSSEIESSYVRPTLDRPPYETTVLGSAGASLSPMNRPGAPDLSLDTAGAVNANVTGTGHRSTPPTMRSPDSIGSPADMPGLSPTSPRTRNRGYSLRRTLFNRTINQTDGAHGAVLELAEPGPSSHGILSSTTSSHSRQPSGKKSTSSIVRPMVSEDDDDLSSDLDVKSGQAQPSATLTNYENWMREKAERSRISRKLRSAYQRTRKFILRIAEIPPTKDGRHIDVDAERKAPLLDERTSKPYIGNTIRSSRYNAWNFLPRQLWAQFSKLANAYFLFVAILQMIPGLSTTGTYTTIVPLLFFVTISIAKEGYDDYRRYRLDREENNRTTQVFRAYQSTRMESLTGQETDTAVLGPKVWANIKWKDVQVGDIVRLSRDDQVPADLILLSAKGENNTAYIETMALDGETNLKSKQPAPCLARTCDTLDRLACSNAHLVVEDPNLDLYNFEGKVTTDGETAPLSNNEVVYRGSVLRNTPEAVGLVIYSGEECKIRMNASKNPRIKAPTLQFVVNKIVIAMVIFVIALSIFNTVAYEIWSEAVEDNAWYLSEASVAFVPILVSFVIMFNTLIPLSLYVSLEIVKVFQRLLLNDIDMYDEESDTPMEARTSTINEVLGQISYIFSDKTGTLTDNCMKFRKLSVAGTAWLHDADLKLDALKEEDKRRRNSRCKGKERAVQAPRKSTSSAFIGAMTTPENLDEPSSPGWKSSARPTKSQRELHTIEMLRYIQRKPFTVFARKARFLLLSVALCHTCLPETKEDGSISYQAASPDELALVQAAQELGYMVVDRISGIVTVRTYPRGLVGEPQEERYEVLDVIEFSSKRKRMSIVVRFPDNRICVFSKGADSIMMNLLRLSSLAFEKSTEIDRRASLRKSVEAQQAIARRSSHYETGPNSPLGRPSFGGVGRPSVGGSISNYRGQLDNWLKEREHDVDASMMDDQSAYSARPSAQYGRPSMGSSSPRSSFQTDHADYELVEEALAVDEPAIIERCLQHINDFATEGLRTLLYGYRFLGEEEYQTWRKVYRDATTSLVDRQKEIERAGELIEHSLELAGATAIEDKLQKGVPETIDKLRRAGIKLWMLTGDKRETAINIGHSCRLIKDYSTLTILDIEKPYLEQIIGSTILAVSSASSTIAHSVVVVDGATLAAIDASPTLKSLFTDLAPLVDSVICCRASPAQKASLVSAVRRKVRSSITLAIGDGANDIAMIQEAHVGIGITGKEGLQAARTSDYSIAQFRFLTKLLLVHGRWNYLRTAKYTAATFWKEMMFYLTQALFQRYAGYTGTSLYESWSLTTFNTLFSSLPVIFLGVFEKDLLPQTLLAVPELYRSMGLRSAAFNFRIYAWWIFLASAEAIIVFFVMYALYGSDDGGGLAHFLGSSSRAGLASTINNSSWHATINPLSGGSDNIYPLGSLTFTACIIIISAKLQLVEMLSVSIANVIAVILSVGGWFLWNLILSSIYADNTIYKVRGAFVHGFGRDPAWWATLAVILAAVAALEISWRVLRWVIGEHSWTLCNWGWLRLRFRLPGPTDAEVFQVLERDPVLLARFEAAAREEMWFSLQGREGAASGAGGGDADVGLGIDGAGAHALERKRTREEEAEREGEIRELLKSRGVGDEATTHAQAREAHGEENVRHRKSKSQHEVDVENIRRRSMGV